MKISSEWLRDRVMEEFEAAVKYGIRRAYKHSDAVPPTDEQADAIAQEVTSAVDRIWQWSPPEELE